MRKWLGFVMMVVLAISLVGCSIQVGDTATTKSETGLSAKQLKADAAGKLGVFYLDVGQGSSQLLISPAGKTMLIDTGDIDKEQLMLKYMKDYDIKKIDILVLSHAHADHIGTASSIIDQIDIGKIYMPRAGNTTKTYENVLKSIKNKGLKVTTAKAGITLDWDEKVKVEMLAPVQATYEDLNDTSAVVKVTYGQSSFLFTGDAERVSEKDMLESKADLSATVLTVGHHGSSSSTSASFLKKVKPKYAVIQVGAGNSYKHPTEVVLNRLDKQGIPVYRNDLNGQVGAITDGKEIKWTLER
ncbi:MBL fold metallo-hydrolase [Paenibacillus sp. N1-5-1-14]|uniref:ComEC/Rec2 family competence protein n=1 Tax=Paenibacillus radicibacter TaxID=2972488 RepID=UPI00215929EA|nr:ComEC/Rec2 family competence protein [Paenibacillus radicibacter]MCR8645682.1 MBL fold metallo-hydrolase [Paenibacillus radicibacter]